MGFIKSEVQSSIDLSSKESRCVLAKSIIKLFELWQLTQEKQCELLGISTGSRARLAAMRKGEAEIPQGRDTFERVGYLLAIHKALRLLYPYNESLRYSWVSRRNQAFYNLSPLDVMQEQGLIGIAKVARYLDHLRGL